ncbi:hypothetical protein HNR46_002667 [Haloferula luteola]|uniref:AsmA-like C-terminal domain-containing protein n=1 Tax=Haloferula luteola TaxID=595692 RepID=A0A840V356_9BACT|nr:hypothetical protein [Haloferula luteola]MBB5352422.1 hypothetical protein [Haloferula luteola]
MSESEKENYSIDEMLDRLKGRSGGQSENEPELVTRPDGSQVYRVRKRKRRSKQPHKEKETRRRRQVMVGVSLGTLAVIAAGVGTLGWVLYLNGSGYESKVQSRIAEVSGAEVDLLNFRATPIGAEFTSLKLDWGDASPVKSLTALIGNGDLDLTSHLTGTWKGDLFGANSVNLVLGKSTGKTTDAEFSGRFPFLSPMRARTLAVKAGNPSSPEFDFSEGLGTLTVTDADHLQATLVVEGGKLRLVNWGSFKLSVASFKLTREGLYLGTAVFSPSGVKDAEFRLHGSENQALPLDGGESHLDLFVSGMPSSQLLGAGMGELFESTLETASQSEPCQLTVDLSDSRSIHLEGSVSSLSSSLVYLRKLPMFSSLARLLENTSYHEPRLELKQPVYFTRDTEKGTLLRDIDFEGRGGAVRIRGEILVGPDHALSGQLELGVHESALLLVQSAAIPGVLPRQGDGYRWGSVKLSGSADKPQDDLQAQIDAVLQEIPPATGGGDRLEDEFESLTQPDH